LRAGVGPLTIGRYKAHSREWTVRAAAVALVESWMGSVEVRDGRLVLASPSPTDPFDQSLREVIETLLAGESLIVAAAKRPGPVDPAKLPDVTITPSGAAL
jgi:hypothetical protein